MEKPDRSGDSESAGKGPDSPAQTQPQVLAAMVQAMLFCALQEGIAPIELLDRAGLKLTEIEPLYRLVPSAKVLALVRAIHTQRPDLSLGLMMGMKLSTAHMGPLGYVLASAPTVGRALQNFVAFQRHLNGGMIVWSVSAEPGQCVVRLSAHADIAAIAWVLEAPITLILKIIRELSGRPVVPLRVSFCHPPPQDTAQHEVFYGVPILWRAADNELVLSDSVLDLSVQTADRALYPSLLNALDARPPQPLPDSPVVQNTRVQILKELAKGSPDKSTVSRALGMAPSTLFRRLREAGTSFEVLVERTRREKSIEVLADATIALGRVADRLGYSEHSSFFRAFVRWFGCTPAEYRASLTRRA